MEPRGRRVIYAVLLLLASVAWASSARLYNFAFHSPDCAPGTVFLANEGNASLDVCLPGSTTGTYYFANISRITGHGDQLYWTEWDFQDGPCNYSETYAYVDNRYQVVPVQNASTPLNACVPCNYNPRILAADPAHCFPTPQADPYCSVNCTQLFLLPDRVAVPPEYNTLISGAAPVMPSNAPLGMLLFAPVLVLFH